MSVLHDLAHIRRAFGAHSTQPCFPGVSKVLSIQTAHSHLRHDPRRRLVLRALRQIAVHVFSFFRSAGGCMAPHPPVRVRQMHRGVIGGYLARPPDSDLPPVFCGFAPLLGKQK